MWACRAQSPSRSLPEGREDVPVTFPGTPSPPTPQRQRRRIPRVCTGAGRASPCLLTWTCPYLPCTLILQICFTCCTSDFARDAATLAVQQAGGLRQSRRNVCFPSSAYFALAGGVGKCFSLGSADFPMSSPCLQVQEGALISWSPQPFTGC